MCPLQHSRCHPHHLVVGQKTKYTSRRRRGCRRAEVAAVASTNGLWIIFVNANSSRDERRRRSEKENS